MARIIQFIMEVTDAEYAAFLERASSRGVLSTGTAVPTGAGTETDDDEGQPNAAAPAVDSRGIPWLESVHASTKGTTADGAWRRKKGVTNEQMTAAENAWKAANPNAAAPAADPTFTVPGSITGGAPVTLADPDKVSLPGAGLPGAGLPGGLPGMTPAPKPVSYEDIGAKYQALAAAGKITPELMGQYYGKHGVADVNVLMNNQDVRNALMADLNLLG